MSSSSPICARQIANKLSYFKGSVIKDFNYCNFTNNGDDIYMRFLGNYSKYKIVMSHLFTIPFRLRGDGSLQRCKDWIKPLRSGNWDKNFLGTTLSRFEDNLYGNNFYLEFDHQFVILTNRNLVSLYRGNKPYKFGK